MPTANYKPTVLIVGAGLGGLMLGALLEKIDIPYIIFERTSLIRPLGTSTLPPFPLHLGITTTMAALTRRILIICCYP